MKTHLSEVIAPQKTSRDRSVSTLVVIEHNLTRSPIPLLRALLGASLKGKKDEFRALLICLLHAPSALIADPSQDGCLRVLDLTSRVSDFGTESSEASRVSNEVLTAIQEVPKESLISVYIDSIDALTKAWGSPSQAAHFLKKVQHAVSSHTSPSRLVLSVSSRCPVLPHLLITAFCPNLHHITLHPPLLLRHVSTAFLLDPPPLTLPPKWWSIFGPFSARERGEAERLYFSAQYSTDAAATEGEVVVEILSRSSGAKGVVRVLEGWSASKGPCKLEELEELKPIFANKKASVPTKVDPTENLAFNLSLTAPQEIARSQVVLPYVHAGQPGTAHAAPAIYYDPDSADDMDDDDLDDL